MMKEVDVYVQERKDNFCRQVNSYFDRNYDGKFAQEALFILKSIK